MKEKVRYFTICTSSLLQKHTQKASYGLFATDPSWKPQQATAVICDFGVSERRATLEAIWSAQLFAHQHGWQKLHIQNDTEEIVSIILQIPDSLGELSIISKDIILFTHLFDNCLITFFPMLENLKE